MDPIFGMQVRFFEGTATFVQKIKLKGGKYEVSGYLQYGACNDENCLPPTNVEFSFKGKLLESKQRKKQSQRQRT